MELSIDRNTVRLHIEGRHNAAQVEALIRTLALMRVDMLPARETADFADTLVPEHSFGHGAPSHGHCITPATSRQILPSGRMSMPPIAL